MHLKVVSIVVSLSHKHSSGVRMCGKTCPIILLFVFVPDFKYSSPFKWRFFLSFMHFKISARIMKMYKIFFVICIYNGTMQNNIINYMVPCFGKYLCKKTVVHMWFIIAADDWTEPPRHRDTVCKNSNKICR